MKEEDTDSCVYAYPCQIYCAICKWRKLTEMFEVLVNVAKMLTAKLMLITVVSDFKTCSVGYNEL